MARVQDVAKYILQKQGTMTSMQLQKLVYYAQVWWLTEHDEPLFDDAIKAWAEGPVVPALYAEHKGRRNVTERLINGDGSALSVEARTKIDSVLGYYAKLPAKYLSDLSHHEKPWKDARDFGERRGYESPVISVGAIKNFYRGASPAQLNRDYQMSLAKKLIDEHAECLARLAR